MLSKTGEPSLSRFFNSFKRIDETLRGRFELPRDWTPHRLSRPAPYRTRLPQLDTVSLVLHGNFFNGILLLSLKNIDIVAVLPDLIQVGK